MFYAIWTTAKYVTTLVWESGMNFKNEWVFLQVFVPEAPHSLVVFVSFLYKTFYSSNQEKKYLTMWPVKFVQRKESSDRRTHNFDIPPKY